MQRMELKNMMPISTMESLARLCDPECCPVDFFSARCPRSEWFDSDTCELPVDIDMLACGNSP